MPKLFKVLAFTLFAALALSIWLSPATTGQNNKKEVDPETGSTSVSILAPTEALTTDMDAKTDDLFNNFGARGTPINECVADAQPPTARGNGRFEDNKFIFEEEETIADGLGPTYNDVGCVTCHQATDTGAFGQQMEFRAGHNSNGSFVDAPGGQLIHARGTDSDVVEHISTAENVRSFRVVLQALGDGFIECIANQDLQSNVAAEPSAQRGVLSAVPVTEANNTLRNGRFGWKAQQASLLSFSGDAYLNEMGITSKFDGFGGRSSNAPEVAWPAALMGPCQSYAVQIDIDHTMQAGGSQVFANDSGTVSTVCTLTWNTIDLSPRRRASSPSTNSILSSTRGSMATYRGQMVCESCVMKSRSLRCRVIGMSSWSSRTSANPGGRSAHSSRDHSAG